MGLQPLLDGDGVVTLMTVRPVEALRSASLLLVVGDAGSLLLIACQDVDEDEGGGDDIGEHKILNSWTFFSPNINSF